MYERVKHDVLGYPQESAELREVIVARLAERYGWRIGAEDILFLPGVIRGFNLACQTVAEPGGAVLVQTPIYPPVLTAPRHANLQRQDVPLCRDARGVYHITGLLSKRPSPIGRAGSSSAIHTIR